MQEAHLELTGVRCPSCAGQLVLRILGEERGIGVLLRLDSACVACGISPWAAPDQRTVVFTPGASSAEALRGFEKAPRVKQSDVESALREEISHLEGELAAARAELRRSEEATRGETSAGKRPIELE